MAINTNNAGGVITASVPQLAWIYFSGWFNFTNTSSATVQTIYQTTAPSGGFGAHVYVQSGKIYYDDCVAKGGTRGRWTWNISDGFQNLSIGHLSGFDVAPTLYLDGVAQTRTQVTAPVDSAIYQAGRWSIGCVPGTNKIGSGNIFKGMFEECALWSIELLTGSFITNAHLLALASGVKRVPMQILRNTDGGIKDRLFFYFPFDEVPHGKKITYATQHSVTGNVDAQWAVVGKTYNYQALSTLNDSNYIQASDTDDGLTDKTSFGTITITKKAGVVAILSLDRGRGGTTSDPGIAIWGDGRLFTLVSITASSITNYWNLWLQNPLATTQAELDDLEYYAIAPATIDKGEDGGRITYQAIYVYQSDWILRDWSSNSINVVCISGYGERGRLTYPE